MSQGLLQYYKAAGTAYEVAMDEVKFLCFGQDDLTSIGTASLNGCSTVMIVSIHGAIIAHIPPHPLHPSGDLQAGDRHVRKKMQEVAALYNTNKQYFPTGGNNGVVCAIYQGELALPDQQKIIQDSLTNLGLPHSFAPYTAGRRRGDSTYAGQGTVFILGDRNPPIVFVEDKDISAKAQWSTAANPQTAASYQASSSYQASPFYQAPPSYRSSSQEFPYQAIFSSQVPFYQASSQLSFVAEPAGASSSTKQSADSSWTWSSEHGKYHRQLADGSYEWTEAQKSSSTQQFEGSGWAWSSEHGRYTRQLADGSYEWAPARGSASTISRADQKGNGKASGRKAKN